MGKPKILIDGDIFAYRAAFSCEDQEVEDALDKVDDLLQWSIYACTSEYNEKKNKDNHTEEEEEGEEEEREQ